MNRFIITDPKKCIGCHTCEIACVMAHTEMDGIRSLQDLTPKDFGPRIHLMESDTVTVAVTCRQCEDSPCANSCPNGAISRVEGVMIVDQQRCIGCQTCVVACPFGAMEVTCRPVVRQNGASMRAMTDKAEAHKCDLCMTRSNGPACIEHCPTDAIFIVDQALRQKLNEDKRKRSAMDGLSL